MTILIIVCAKKSVWIYNARYLEIIIRKGASAISPKCSDITIIIVTKFRVYLNHNIRIIILI